MWVKNTCCQRDYNSRTGNKFNVWFFSVENALFLLLPVLFLAFYETLITKHFYSMWFKCVCVFHWIIVRGSTFILLKSTQGRNKIGLYSLPYSIFLSTLGKRTKHIAKDEKVHCFRQNEKSLSLMCLQNLEEK